MITGQRLPGRTCGGHQNVHVGIQVGSQPHDLVPGDAASAHWNTEVEVVRRADTLDFRGAAVHGRPGERFLYLTWGELDRDRFDMFRRAKLMLADSGADEATEHATAEVELTDDRGMPCCARVHEPNIRWRVR